MSFGPKTLAEARKHRYGTWAGNPRGNPYREGFCIEEIMPDVRGPLPRQCHGRGVPRCSIHIPGAKEARAAKRPPTRYDREMAAIDQRIREHGALKRIAKGDCACAGIAKAALEKAAQGRQGGGR